MRMAYGFTSRYFDVVVINGTDYDNDQVKDDVDTCPLDYGTTGGSQCSPVGTTCCDIYPQGSCITGINNSFGSFYCNTNGKMTSNCSLCGCYRPTVHACDTTKGTCYDNKCYEGTAFNTCSPSKPYYCIKVGNDSSNIIDNCTYCGCPSGQGCDPGTNQCKNVCSDGTLPAQCSPTQPLYCNGVLVTECSKCGCPSGLTCSRDRGGRCLSTAAVILYDDFDNFSNNWYGNINSTYWHQMTNNWLTGYSRTGRSYAMSGPMGGAGTAEITRTQSTVGYTNINVSFYTTDSLFTTGAYMNISWYNGAAWTIGTSISARESAWAYHSFTTTAAADNNPNFAVKVSCHDTTSTTGYCNLDSLMITGSGNAVCGNSFIEGNEQCDGTNFNGQTCVSKGFAGGTLKCGPTCSHDTSSCLSSLTGTQIFYDDFNNLGNWYGSINTTWWHAVSGSSCFSGSTCAQGGPVYGYIPMTHNQSTVGYTNITFSFYSIKQPLDSAENMTVNWYNGTGWTTAGVISVSENDWTYHYFTTTAAANNNPKFAVQVTCFDWHYPNNDYACMLDSLTIRGQGNASKTCSDGTPYGQCSVTTPNYCSNGTIVNNCSLCGCPTGQSCNATTNACYVPPSNRPPNNPAPVLASSSGTNTTVENLICSSTVSDPDGDAMNTTVNWYKNDVLSLAVFYNNIASGQTVSSTLKSGNLSAGDVWKCGMIASDGKANSSLVYSNPVTIKAQPPANSAPNTPLPVLSSTSGANLTSDNLNCYAKLSDPEGNKLNATVNWYKNNVLTITSSYNYNYPNGTDFTVTLSSGNLTAGDAWRCGMRLYDGSLYSGWGNSSSLVVVAPAPVSCSDGTASGQCSATRPKYCSNGTLADNCALCGCPTGQSCNSSNNACYLPTCSDGTAYGQCSATRPKFCSNGTLIDNCPYCGCPSGQSCNSANNVCYIPACSDGTLYGLCSATKPKYCNNGNLVDNCASCGCPTGQSCNSTSNACYVPIAPPQNCSDGTTHGQCSATKPKYCNNGTLINNCSSCGCPSGYSCNASSNTCYVPTCSDGTLYGQCSATKPNYCSNGVLINNCQLCGCPSGKSCNATSSACYVPMCSDGTLYGACSPSRPKYCNNGNLIDNCIGCGCPSGQSCNTTSNACYLPIVPPQNCSDGTASGQCSATRPKFCSNGTLADNCSLCGCQAGYACNTTSNACYVQTCSDGTLYSQCSITKPNYCSNGAIVSNCSSCGCPSGKSCNASSNACYTPSCSDGTLYGLCSATKPKYCNNGNLVDNCASCGCPSGLSCNASSNACYAPTCSDGTLYNQCSATRPKYCSNGTLADNCALCGCPSGQSCNSSSNSCYVQTCSDGTLYGLCSATKPKYCSNGNLVDNCASCGCPSGYSCNSTSNACYVPKCSDGTLYGQCSATKPNYCSNGILVTNCSLCGCPIGLSCNASSSACYVPVVPPQNCSDGTPCYQCSATKPKYCNNGTLINKCTVCSCDTNGGCNSKSEKCRKLPAIKSSSGTNTSIGVNATATTAENLICSWAASDLNGNVDVTFTWYKNDAPVLTSSFTNVSSDVTLAVELASGNLSAGDTWMCGVEAVDADNATSEVNSTPMLIIEPSVPPAPVQPPSGGGGGGGGGAAPPSSGGVIVTSSQPAQTACINSLEVTVPDQIFVPQGVTKEISIIVKNTGTCPLTSVAAALSLPAGWSANSYMLDSGLGVNETGIMSIRLLPLYSPIGNYPVTVKLDAPNVTMSKSAKVWLLENPPSVVSQEGPSASKIFEYIIALLLIEFVFGSIVMVIWYKPEEKGKLPPLPQVSSNLEPIKPNEWWKRQ